MAITKLQPFNLDSTANYTFANITAGNANLGNAVTANYFIGNGSLLTGVDTSPANISNGTSNVQVISSGGNVTTSVAGNANIFVVTGTGANISGTANITGNLSAGNLLGPLANGNSNVRIATANGNITITAVGNTTMTITGTGANISGTANITGNANIGNIGTSIITATGNITGANLLGPLANGNSNVRIATSNGNVTIAAVGNTTLTITGTGANISGTANITGNVSAPYFIGNGFYLTGVDTSPSNISNGTSNVQIIQNGNVNTSVNGNANVVVVTGLGSNISGYLSVSGNVSGGNVTASGQLTSTQSTGTAPLVVLSTTQVANLNSALAGTVTTAAQPNITSVGSLTGLTVSNATGIVDFTTTSNVTLGAVANLHIAGGSANYVLKTDGSGNLDWVAVGGISVISSISNGNSNVNIATSNGNVTLTAVGNTTMTVTGTGANISGYANITGNVSLTGANINLGNVGNLRISGGASSYVLSTDGASNLSWVAQSGGGGSSSAIQEFSATSGQTTFTVVGGYQVGSVIVFVNGIQMNNGDYTAANGTTVVLSEPRISGDVVRILSSMASPAININSLQNFSVAMSIALGI
jgi:hypothetical protein